LLHLARHTYCHDNPFSQRVHLQYTCGMSFLMYLLGTVTQTIPIQIDHLTFTSIVTTCPEQIHTPV